MKERKAFFRWRLRAAALSVFAGALLGWPGEAKAGVGLGATPTFPSGVTVGQSSLTASLNIQNLSTPPDSAGNVKLTQITLIPACGNATSNCVGGADPGVFQISASATGRIGPRAQGPLSQSRSWTLPRVKCRSNRAAARWSWVLRAVDQLPAASISRSMR